MCFFFLKYNSIFHFTLASTTGGKDLGLQNITETKYIFPPLLSISCWFGLLCFCLFFTVLVRHMHVPLQSAMEEKGVNVD